MNDFSTLKRNLREKINELSNSTTNSKNNVFQQKDFIKPETLEETLLKNLKTIRTLSIDSISKLIDDVDNPYYKIFKKIWNITDKITDLEEEETL